MEGILEEVGQDLLSDRIYAQLSNAIKLGAFGPGEVLKIRSLADMLGTSPTPVREALARLVNQKAVELRPSSRSAVIPRITQASLEEVYAIRIQLECMSARAAALVIEPKEIDQLETVNEDMFKEYERGNRKGTLDKNCEFHFSLYRAARRPVLLGLIDNLWLLCGPLIQLALKDDAEQSAYNSLHDVAIEALRKRDVEGVAEAIEGDLRFSLKTLRALAEKHDQF